MRIIYDSDAKVFFIKLEYPETETVFCTKDIVEVKEEFLKKMENVFNNTICELLTEVTTCINGN